MLVTMNAKCRVHHLLATRYNYLSSVKSGKNENAFKLPFFPSDPDVSILGGPDHFINAGSFINLTCVANFLPGLPLDVDWFHEKKVGLRCVESIVLIPFCFQKVSFSGPRGGVSSIVEKGRLSASHSIE